MGARRVRPGEESYELPDWWEELPDEAWENALFDWLREVMRAVAARGEGKLYADFSDRRGLDELLRLPECVSVPGDSVVCDATEAAIEALLGTNISQLVQTVGADVFLYAANSWEGLFLCVEDEELLRRFGDPA